MAAEQKADAGGRDSRTWNDACESLSSERSARLEASQEQHNIVALEREMKEGMRKQGRRLEDKQQDACPAALRGRLHVQLDTGGDASLFRSLTQYKQTGA